MLSILINDALDGVDVTRKYPAFYSRILGAQELRSAFFETLELLEQSRTGKLLEYSGPKTINLDFLNETCCKPTSQTKSAFNWQITAEHLQNSFATVDFQPHEECCEFNPLLEESPINLIQSQITINNRLTRVRLDMIPVPDELESLRLILFISPPPDTSHYTEATVIWGNYQETVEVNEWGLARFSTLETRILFNTQGQVNDNLNLRLKQKH